MAEIDNMDEQSVVSSLASFDGSWLGLRKPANGQWEWQSGRDRDVHYRDGFWSRHFMTEADRDYCAAIDSRGTHFNVDPVHCDDRLHLLCEFESADQAHSACQGDIHVIELDTENEIPSLEYCLRDEGGSSAVDEQEFLTLRTRENGAPVFCPMNLDERLDSPDAQCCESCLASTVEALTEEEEEEEVNDDDESEAVPLNSHFVFLIVNFLLTLFLMPY